jgi:hypothetical protein
MAILAIFVRPGGPVLLAGFDLDVVSATGMQQLPLAELDRAPGFREADRADPPRSIVGNAGLEFDIDDARAGCGVALIYVRRPILQCVPRDRRAGQIG